MPKVTEKYLLDRKDHILKCTAEILSEKPLYHITMKDITEKTGFSHGAVYRYYPNIDEIYIDFVNSHTAYDTLERKIDTLLDSGRQEKSVISESIIEIGRYIEELLKTVGGKTCFELLIVYANGIEKRNAVYPKLRFKQSLEYAQAKIVEYVLRNVENGALRLNVPINAVIMFVGVCIDGIVQNVALNTESSGKGQTFVLDVGEAFQTLAKAVTNFLE